MCSYDNFLSPPVFFFFFNDPATTEIYTLSLHDALPISCRRCCCAWWNSPTSARIRLCTSGDNCRSEEHTSELQSRPHLVCRLLLEKKNDQPLALTRAYGAHFARARDATPFYVSVVRRVY